MISDIITTLTFAIIMSAIVLRLLTLKNEAASLKPGDPRAELFEYRPILDPGTLLGILILPLYAPFILLLLKLFLPIDKQDFDHMLSFTGGIVVNSLAIAILYYMILLPLFPAIKKKLRPSTCIVLWLLPNVLGPLVHTYSLYGLNTEEGFTQWVVVLKKGSLLSYLLIIWFAGFLGALLYAILSHLHYRRRLLQEARPWDNEEAQKRWRALLAEYHWERGAKRLKDLQITSAVATPVSIGLFLRSTRVILPEKAYSEEELELILRHEILHLIHKDPWAKFHISTVRALLWFNPLIWLSCRSFSEDLERSCDELVLGDSPEEIRQRYAALLLNNASDAQGFTTCLSASAHSLKSRMQDALHPVRRKRGGLLVFLLIFLLCFPVGRITLAYGGGNLKCLVLQGESLDPSIWEVVAWGNDYDWSYYRCNDPEAFCRAVENLTVHPVLGRFTSESDDWSIKEAPFMGSRFEQENNEYFDDILHIYRNHIYCDGNLYYIEESDWETLWALFQELFEEYTVEIPLDVFQEGLEESGFLLEELTN